MESKSYKQIALLPPNPVTKRAFPASSSISPDNKYLAYTCKMNVILRNLNDPSQSLVYSDFIEKAPTTVKLSPDGKYLAIGQENGRVRIVQFNEETKEFSVKKEHSMLSQEVNAIAFTDDGSKMIAVGQGKDMYAKAVITESGSKQGDVTGPNKQLLTVDIRQQKPYRAVISGENYDLYIYDGAPFKHVKTITSHTNFVNKVAFSLDGSHFVSVSSDKSIVIYNSETLEEVVKREKAHSKGIIDVAWIDQETILTCSTDNQLKIWKTSDLSEQKTLKIDESEEKVDYQQLSLQVLKDRYISISLNSNINVWNKDSEKATQIIQGHNNNISKILSCKGQLVSADQNGRIFTWNSDFQGQLFSNYEESHTDVTCLIYNQNNEIFASYTDGTIRKCVKSETGSYSIQNSIKDEKVISMVNIQNKQICALSHKNSLMLVNGENLEITTKQEIKNFQSTYITFSDVTNELWIGDKQGVIHIYDIEKLQEKSKIEKKHNHQITYMKTSNNGQMIATGDSYRYIYVFKADTYEEVACFPYHTAQIIGLDFNKDDSLLLTSSFDRNVGIANLSTKQKQIIESKVYCSQKLFIEPNDKGLNCAIFDDQDRIVTAGYDCSIRIWSY